MKKKLKRLKRKAVLAGANTTFNIMGDGLELRDNDNLEASWYNVGVYFKRSINQVSSRNGYGKKYSKEELETY